MVRRISLSDCIDLYHVYHVYHVLQEDAHLTVLDLKDGTQTSLFAVFDGHGGDLVSKYTAKHLPRILVKTDAYVAGDLGLAVAESFYKIDEILDSKEGIQELLTLAGVERSKPSSGLFSDIERSITIPDVDDDTTEQEPKKEKDTKDAAPSMDRSKSSSQFIESALARDSVITQKQIEEAEGISSNAAPAEEEDFAEHRATGMGCTAVTALIRGKHVYIANTGDSRCVISRKGIAEPLTLDHKPVLLEEAERIMKAGGFVRDNRVNGALNVSRTIGDLDFKKNAELPHTHQMVVATPDITTFELQKGDEFLILACDGIWDVLSNQEAVDLVRKKIKQGEDLKSICEDVCDHCLAPDLRGLCRGADNMSLIIVVFKQTADLHNPVWNSIRRMFSSLRC